MLSLSLLVAGLFFLDKYRHLSLVELSCVTERLNTYTNSMLYIKHAYQGSILNTRSNIE